jgi:hypothetical protein
VLKSTSLTALIPCVITRSPMFMFRSMFWWLNHHSWWSITMFDGWNYILIIKFTCLNGQTPSCVIKYSCLTLQSPCDHG